MSGKRRSAAVLCAPPTRLPRISLFFFVPRSLPRRRPRLCRVRVRQCAMQLTYEVDPRRRTLLAINVGKYLSAFPVIWLSGYQAMQRYHGDANVSFRPCRTMVPRASISRALRCCVCRRLASNFMVASLASAFAFASTAAVVPRPLCWWW